MRFNRFDYCAENFPCQGVQYLQHHVRQQHNRARAMPVILLGQA
jgi:hypothetical protein